MLVGMEKFLVKLKLFEQVIIYFGTKYMYCKLWILCLVMACCNLFADNVYTNHAGNVVCGNVITLTRTEVVFTNSVTAEVLKVPLSIFPESEKRRICADGGTPSVPRNIINALDGARKQIERSRGRARKGLCSEGDYDKNRESILKSIEVYLSTAYENGEITKKERDVLINQSRGY